MKITQLSSLNEVQIHLVKQLIKECQMFDGTHKEPYLLNTLNFDKRMPSFFSDMKKKRLLITICIRRYKRCGGQHIYTPRI